MLPVSTSNTKENVHIDLAESSSNLLTLGVVDPSWFHSSDMFSEAAEMCTDKDTVNISAVWVQHSHVDRTAVWTRWEASQTKTVEKNSLGQTTFEV